MPSFPHGGPPLPQGWAALLIGEVLEAVFNSHRGQPEETVRQALVEEYTRRGFAGVTEMRSMVTAPTIVIAAGHRVEQILLQRSPRCPAGRCPVAVR